MKLAGRTVPPFSDEQMKTIAYGVRGVATHVKDYMKLIRREGEDVFTARLVATVELKQKKLKTFEQKDRTWEQLNGKLCNEVKRLGGDLRNVGGM